MSSRLVQVTLVPALTVSTAGVKVKLSIVTWLGSAPAAGAPDSGKAVTVTAAKARPISAARARVNTQRAGRPGATVKSCDEHIAISKLLLNATYAISVPDRRAFSFG